MSTAEILGMIQIADLLMTSAARMVNMSKEAIDRNPDLTEEEKTNLLKRIELAKNAIPEW